MFWQVLFCVLAAAGLCLFVWCIVGFFLLPLAGRNLEMTYYAYDTSSDLEHTVRGLSWLYQIGVVDMPLRIVDCGMNAESRERAEMLALRYSYIQIVRESE